MCGGFKGCAIPPSPQIPVQLQLALSVSLHNWISGAGALQRHRALKNKSGNIQNKIMKRNLNSKALVLKTLTEGFFELHFGTGEHWFIDRFFF